MFHADLRPRPALLAQDRDVELNSTEDSQHSWIASNRSLLRKHLCTFRPFDPLGHENKHLKKRHISVKFIFKKPKGSFLALTHKVGSAQWHGSSYGRDKDLVTGPLGAFWAIPASQQDELQGREMPVGLLWGSY